MPVAVADAESAEESIPHISIILPCYNEEGRVIAEVERTCAAMDASGYCYEVLAVDVASTDQTLARRYEAAPRFPNLEVVHFRRNGGSGVVWCIGTERARGQIVVWTDADMTFKFITDAYRYILQVLRMVMYFNPLKVLMPVGLALLSIGFVKGVYDVAAHPFRIATDTVLMFMTGLLIASLAPLADLIVHSRSAR